MAELSVSNSPNTRPMRLIAFSDGASGEFSATLCAFPTSSSFGTAMFVSAASATQNRTIGSASARMVRGTRGRDC